MLIVIGSSVRRDDADRHGQKCASCSLAGAASRDARACDRSAGVIGFAHHAGGWRSRRWLAIRWVFVPMGAAPEPGQHSTLSATKERNMREVQSPGHNTSSSITWRSASLFAVRYGIGGVMVLAGVVVLVISERRNRSGARTLRFRPGRPMGPTAHGRAWSCEGAVISTFARWSRSSCWARL